MKNSRGQLLGSTTVLFFVTIAIVIILIVFALGSVFIRKVGSGGGLKVSTIDEVGLNNLRVYMENYQSLLIRLYEEGKNG
jgi:hypothetical protein